jgi:hypothetical protein
MQQPSRPRCLRGRFAFAAWSPNCSLRSTERFQSPIRLRALTADGGSCLVEVVCRGGAAVAESRPGLKPSHYWPRGPSCGETALLLCPSDDDTTILAGRRASSQSPVKLTLQQLLSLAILATSRVDQARPVPR